MTWVQTNHIQNGARQQNQWLLFILLSIYYLFRLVWNGCNWFQVNFKIENVYNGIDSKIVTQQDPTCTTLFTHCSHRLLLRVAHLQNLIINCTTWFSNDTNQYVNSWLLMTSDLQVFAQKTKQCFCISTHKHYKDEEIRRVNGKNPKLSGLFLQTLEKFKITMKYQQD